MTRCFLHTTNVCVVEDLETVMQEAPTQSILQVCALGCQERKVSTRSSTSHAMIWVKEKFFNHVHHSDLALCFRQSSPHNVSYRQVAWLSYPLAMPTKKAKRCNDWYVFGVAAWLNGFEPMPGHTVAQIATPFLTTLFLDPSHELFHFLSDINN